MENLLKAVSIGMLLALTVFVLIIGKNLILPLVCAMFLFYLLINLAYLLHNKLRLPWMLAWIVSIGSVMVVLSVGFSLVVDSLYAVIQQAPDYQTKATEFLSHLTLGFDGHDIQPQKVLEHLSLPDILSSIASSVASIAKYTILIGIYTLFIGLEYRSFLPKLKAICNTDRRYNAAERIVQDILRDVGKYFRIKSLISMTTGILSYLVLKFAGVSYAEFWGVCIFALNYIPTLGSILGVVIVLPVVLVQFTSIPVFVVIAGLLIAIQAIMGNFVEPRLMGRSLNLSPLVILLALAFWGTIWGPIGALLCVPLMVVINIIMAKLPATRSIAIMLSESGRIRGE